MAKKLCAANWKLNKNPSETASFIQEFLAHPDLGDPSEYIIFPSAICLPSCQSLLSSSQVGWGAQNVYSEPAGAFTGENSAQVVKDIGATHVLVGHSERRSLFNEDDKILAQKFKLVQSLGLTPMLCVGESLAQRESGETQEVISEQLRKGLLFAELDQKFIIAYEPVWAIGTGKVASVDQAEEAHRILRMVLDEMGGGDVSEAVSILYGGSVKPENAAELGSQPNVDGFLIGGASLKVDSFVAIHKAMSS